MDASLEPILTTLDNLSAGITASCGENKTPREMIGQWNMPSVSRDQLAAKSSNLAAQIRKADPTSIPGNIAAALANIPARLSLLQGEQVPHFWNGNSQIAVANYTSALESLEELLRPVLGWQYLPSPDQWPPEIVKRTRSAASILKRIAPEIEKLDEKVQRINEAYAAAQDLPTVMDDLEEARASIGKTSTTSSEIFGKIDDEHKRARIAADDVAKLRDVADKLVEQCEIAYRITTTKGLAAAFDQRATRLSRSMWVWVVFLSLTLGVALYIGHDRLSAMNNLLDDPKTEMSRIWMHALLTVFSIAAPVWFAWLATKQIGQRFRLSEDYGFKASVAKAYEGYRKEAARIDPELERRLFSSALTRLEEAPLRLVENESHGSPWQEFFSSDLFRLALEKVPGLKGKFEKAKERSGTPGPQASNEHSEPKAD